MESHEQTELMYAGGVRPALGHQKLLGFSWLRGVKWSKFLHKIGSDCKTTVLYGFFFKCLFYLSVIRCNLGLRI